jgi:hypothetical protein
MPGGLVRIVVGVVLIITGVAGLVASPVLGVLYWGIVARREAEARTQAIVRDQWQRAASFQMQVAAAAQAQAQGVPPTVASSQSGGPAPSPSVVVNVPAQPPTPVYMKCSHCGTVGNLLLGRCQSCGATYL